MPTRESLSLLRKDGIPERPASKPPRRLNATLGKFIGSGRTSVVYALENVCIPDLGPHVIVPPIARLHRAFLLAREAWFYEDPGLCRPILFWLVRNGRWWSRQRYQWTLPH